MSENVSGSFSSSIIKKQIVAVTGLMMVGFLCAHMAGNLLILAGPEAFNGYAALLHTIPELLWVMRLGMVAAFAVLNHLGRALEARAPATGAPPTSSRRP